jgi:uncharacterized protein (TIGR03435 family)
MNAVPRALLLSVAGAALAAVTSAQTPASAEFDVVSVKRVTEVRQGGGFRTLPDGSEVMTNMPVAGFVRRASPVKVREVFGLPEWANTERFDVTVKPPAGSTEEQRGNMWRALFADRMKMTAHIEPRERTVYALVTARSDGRPGSELKPSALDCRPRPETPPAPGAPVRFSEFKSRCGWAMNGTSIVSGGLSMDQLAQALDGEVDAEVENRTGLQGWYQVELTYAPPLRITGAAADAARAGDAADIFTAVQEQLGLKLVREKQMRPVLVVDHIERPTEN